MNFSPLTDDLISLSEFFFEVKVCRYVQLQYRPERLCFISLTGLSHDNKGRAVALLHQIRITSNVTLETLNLRDACLKFFSKILL